MWINTCGLKWCIIVVIFTLNIKCGALRTGCSLDVTNESTEKFLPVAFYNLSWEYKLVVPSKGAVPLNNGGKIVLLCPGPRNYITLTHSNVSSISCIEGSTVQIFNKITDFDDLQCKKIPKGEVFTTKEKCPNSNVGYFYTIGYPVTKTAWTSLIHICYEPEIGKTLYTWHVIHGKAMKYASKSNYRPGFSTSGLPDDVTASVAYKKPYQKSTFSQILKSSLLAGNYINGKSFLVRGHLSPDADFLLATSQFSTYYYINTAPQWQGVNTGSWKSIESTVRKLSSAYENLQIITGTHGVLKYPDASGTSKAIYLVSGNKLPVPKYFWKIVYDADSEKAIVFVILNDPFVDTVKEQDVFCRDICQDYGYRNNAWRKISTGYVFCCDYDNFRNVVKNLPTLATKGVIGI